MTGWPAPVVARQGAGSADAPLVVLLHGRGSNERDIVGLADHLPAEAEYVAVRAPIAEGGGFAWFANRGIGRPVTESLRATMDWFRSWLDAEVQPGSRPVVLVGFSGGAAFAGGLLLDDPARYAGAAILFGTVPFDAGVPVDDGRLAGVRVLVEQGDTDTVIPRELLDRTWAYVVEASGAIATTHRSSGGHGLDADALGALRSWLAGLIAPPASAIPGPAAAR